ncbi:MAG TPA: glycoside hydrolase family 31 protein [Kiritimatiellia bacterium]|nr:glycoside hydrolase family 31 protein [Kiritimatiellia bacterium]HMP00196.1 glycoside hydrolase family 31 protein [Kiritimatiellia bacterium]HMP96726.1 glycoside hydrolase family 31 protein [Kiritimatiellia bacterium]
MKYNMHSSIQDTLARTFAALLALFSIEPASAGTSMRDLLSHRLHDRHVLMKVTDGSVKMTFYSANAVEVVFTPVDTSSQPSSFALAGEPEPVAIDVVESGSELRIQTEGLSVTINKSPFRLSYRYRNRDVIEENPGFVRDASRSGFRFRIGEQERFFGGGSRALGRMDRRGERLELYAQSAYDYAEFARTMYYSMPAVVSSRRYMLVFDNAARGEVDIDSTGDRALHFQAVGGRWAYVLIAGETWPELAFAIAETTGRQPMLPRWALGHFASRFGYQSRAEAEAVVAGHIEDGIPLDAIIFDLYWFGPDLRGYMGNLDWDRVAFPEPEEMIHGFNRKGIKTILITEPFILTESKNWADAVARDALVKDAEGNAALLDTFFGQAGLVDVFCPSARDWFWGFYKRHMETGVAGWWGDLGEPETHPDDVRHVNGRGEDVHNAYGHTWARMVYEGFRRDFPHMRPFNLMRSGFVGSQRYAMLPWSGDVQRSWGGLRSQVEISLQMGLQGVAYMHSDLGGYTGGTQDPELYIRWMQYGVFQPIYRPHAHPSVPPEPIFWDDDTKRIVRESIRLRYRLLPYHYTLMFENATIGLPLMRPMMFLDDHPDSEVRMDAYLWGDALLVAPILDPGVSEKTVMLPAGMHWFDFWTGQRHEGGGAITVPITMDHIPVFVRGGAFLPTVPVVMNTGLYDPGELRVDFYADPWVTNSIGRLYDDDGATPDAYENKQYELLMFHSERTADGRLILRIEGERHDYPDRPDVRTIHFRIHGLERQPCAVRLDGGDVSDAAMWLQDVSILELSVEWMGQPRVIEIDLVHKQQAATFDEATSP